MKLPSSKFKNKGKQSEDFSFNSIDEEIEFIKNTQLELEENYYHFQDIIDTNKKLRNKTLHQQITKTEEKKIRIENMKHDIYKLQLEHFAESISRIQKNKLDNTFIISFDPSEKIPNVVLEEKDYRDLMLHRDSNNCTPITEGFINTNSNHGVQRNSLKPKTKTTKFIIGKFELPNYRMCHHCKLLKPHSDLVKCTMNNTKIKNYSSSFPKIKVFFVNNQILLIQENIFIIQNYEGNIRDLLDYHFMYEKNKLFICDKYYCTSCLSSNYGIVLQDKDKSAFVCPCCSNYCTCSRCLREERLIKLIGCYFSINGNIDELCYFLSEKNKIFNLLKDYIKIARFIQIDFSEKKNKINKNGKGKKVTLTEIKKYKSILEEYQMFLGKSFEKIKKEKMLGTVNHELITIESKEAKLNLLGKKKAFIRGIDFHEETETLSSSEEQNIKIIINM